METTHRPTLGSLVRHTVVLAYREDTTLLENALRGEGLDPFVQRKTDYSPLEMTHSRTIRCLMNHAEAWHRAATASGHTLVVEADFVPCLGCSRLSAPFDTAIHYKHCHLTRREHRNCLHRLLRHGYHTAEIQFDVFAWLENPPCSP